MAQLHTHVPAAVLKAQVRYVASPVALLTAQAIVQAKLWNCYRLLGSYRAARVRSQSGQVQLIDDSQRRIARLAKLAAAATSRQALFLREAEAAASYWRTVSVVCRADAQWQRAYPHALDIRNVLLNTGYTILARRVMAALIQADLAPEIGVLHGDEASEALAYDVMECFRQVGVDAIVIPLFSRQVANTGEDAERIMKRGVAGFTRRWEKRFPYRGRCEKLDAILLHDVIRLRKAIMEMNVWQPYRHRWGHSWKCQ